VAVELTPMPEDRLEHWLTQSLENYAESRETAGDSPALARAHAERSMSTYFPDGRPLEGHFVWDVTADGVCVGALWIGPHPQIADGKSWWVYDVEIDEEHRRRGYGRAALLLGEEKVRRLGGTTLGLNVFGFNTEARRLYESLGYGVQSVQMRKPLTAPRDPPAQPAPPA
jgi:ribosomal protein S18 acetylase RimI-like enzyme